MHIKNAAFTLIELLVVITIVGILAGLALPIFGRVQEQGRITQCASNLRQIGGALLGFAGDHNGVLPQAAATIPYAPPATRAGDLSWTEQLETYVGTDRSVYACPSSKRAISQDSPYSYFMGCHAAYFANHTFSPVRLPLLQSPAKYILGGDISAALFDATDSDKDDYTQNPAFAASPAPFHGGKVNILFADGHVGAYAAFNSRAMTTHYDLKADGTGYDYSDR